jgi:hypothetical protein
LLVGHAGRINVFQAPTGLGQEDHLPTGAERSRASARNDLLLIRGEAWRRGLPGRVCAPAEEQVLPYTWFETRMGARPRIDRPYLAIGSHNPSGPASYGFGR